MRKIPWVVIGILIILIGLEVGVFRQRWFWAAVPRSDVGIYYLLEEQIRNSLVKPRIVIFGDSRARAGVTAYYLEQKLGLERGEVLNLALTAGTPWDARLFIKRNPDILDSASLILYQPSDWQFNEYFPPINRVRHFAKLAERLEYRSFITKSELTAGYFIHAIAARDVAKGHLRRLLTNTAKWILGRYTPSPPIIDSITGRVLYRVDESEYGPDTVDVGKDITSFYKDFAYSVRVAGDITALIEIAREHGTRFVFLDMPLRESYVSMLQSDYLDFFTVYRDSLHSLADKKNVEIWGGQETKAQAGITENMFYDYGHLTLEGMKRYNLWLADRILESLILEDTSLFLQAENRELNRLITDPTRFSYLSGANTNNTDTQSGGEKTFVSIQF